MTSPEPAAAQKTSFLSHVGTVALSIVKHVPTRGVLWAVIGFFVGWIFIGLSWVLILLTMGRGAELAVYFFVVMVAIPFAGGALFATHGLHRGAARAALELELKFGLVKWIVGRVFVFLENRIGGRLSNLPLDAFEQKLRSAIDAFLGSDEMLEGRGMMRWVLRRAKRPIVSKVEAIALAAYRAELKTDGGGGGVSLEKVGARVSEELSTKLGATLMAPLNKQLVIFMILYAIVGIGWFHIILALGGLLAKLHG